MNRALLRNLVALAITGTIASIAFGGASDLKRKRRFQKIENELSGFYHTGDEAPSLQDSDRLWLKRNHLFVKETLLAQLKQEVTYGSVILTAMMAIKEALPLLRAELLRASEEAYNGESMVWSVTDFAHYERLTKILDVMTKLEQKNITTTPVEKKNLERRAEKVDSALAVLFNIDPKLGCEVAIRRLEIAVSQGTTVERCTMGIALFEHGCGDSHSLSDIKNLLGKDHHQISSTKIEYPCIYAGTRRYRLQIVAGKDGRRDISVVGGTEN